MTSFHCLSLSCFHPCSTCIPRHLCLSPCPVCPAGGGSGSPVLLGQLCRQLWGDRPGCGEAGAGESPEGTGRTPAAPCAGSPGLGERGCSGLRWQPTGTAGPCASPPSPISNGPVSLLFQSRKGADPEREKKVPECKADSIGSGRAIPMKQVRSLPTSPVRAGSLGRGREARGAFARHRTRGCLEQPEWVPGDRAPAWTRGHPCQGAGRGLPWPAERLQQRASVPRARSPAPAQPPQPRCSAPAPLCPGALWPEAGGSPPGGQRQNAASTVPVSLSVLGRQLLVPVGLLAAGEAQATWKRPRALPAPVWQPESSNR